MSNYFRPSTTFLHIFSLQLASKWTPTGTHVHGQTATGHTRRQQTLNGIRGSVSVNCRPPVMELIFRSQTRETFGIAAGCAGSGMRGATCCRGIWFRIMGRSLQPLVDQESRLGECSVFQVPTAFAPA